MDKIINTFVVFCVILLCIIDLHNGRFVVSHSKNSCPCNRYLAFVFMGAGWPTFLHMDAVFLDL